MNKLVLILILSLLGGMQVFSKNLKQSPKLIKGQLKNGLTYYIYPNNLPKGEAVYRLFIKSGSVLEEDNQRGLAHFLEHMAFNGTVHFPDNSLTDYLESKGAKFGVDLNAHTSMNETVYKLQLPCSDPAFVDSTLMILADWAGGLLLDSLQIEEERGVILSEWLLQVGPKHDAKNALLLELLNKSRFSQRLTIGDTAVIRNFPPQAIREFYQSWYDPSLMAVAIAGDVNPKTTEKLIKKWFSPLKSKHNGNIPTYTIDDYDDVSVREVSHESLDGIELNVLQLLDKPSPVKTEEDYPAYLQRLLLNKLIRERFASLSFNNPPYSKASYSYSSFLNSKGILGGSVELVPEKIEAGIIDFATESERIFRYGFVSVEIEKVKKKYLSQMRTSVESKSLRESKSFIDEIYADFYVENKIVDLKEEYKLASKYIESIDSVSFIRLLHSIRNPDKTHYLLTSFDKAASELPNEKRLIAIFDSIHSSSIEPYVKNIHIPESLLTKEPKPGTIISQKRIEKLEADSLVLSNGAKVIFRQSSLDKDRILVSGFRQGGMYALDSLDFVNSIFAGSVIPLSGAGSLSRDELSLFLAGQNISMRFLIEKTRSGIVGGSAIKTMENMFRLLYLKWTQPRIDSLIFEQVKQKSIEKYLTENKTETDKYYKELEILLSGSNYTNRELSDQVINAELKYDRLLPVFNANFGSAKDFNFLIIGDCTLDEIKPFIEQYIGGLPSGDVVQEYKFTGDIIPDKSLDFEKNVGDNPRTSVSLIFQDNKIDTVLSVYTLQADFMKDIIRNQLLKTLREELGKVYSVGVSVSATQHPAVLRRSTIRFASKPEDVDTLINRTISELKNMAIHPESFESMLADTKLNLIKQWKANIQRNTYWTNSIRNAVYNDEKNWDFILDYERLVNETTAETISKAIQTNFIDTPMIKAILNPKDNNIQSLQQIKTNN